MTNPDSNDPGGDTPRAPVDCVPDLVIDARGLRCPLPLLRAKQGLRTLAVGALLHVRATDQGSVRDFQSYASISGHRLEGFGEANGEFEFWLRKAD